MADAQRTERFQQLEERVNQRVREAVSQLQEELRERLRRAGDQVVEQLERELQDTEPDLAGPFLSSEELDPLAREAAAEAGREARHRTLTELLSALSAIDRGDSQTAVLSGLVREAGRFAGRTALFLARPRGLELWSAHGWDVSLEGTVVEYVDDGPWSRESLGRGTASLGSGDSGRLCGQVDAPLPTAALLVPLVLRDRLAAVLYADHGEGEELLAEALQGLTYASALALETLPFRERSSTPTLVATGAAAWEEGESLGVWSAAAPPAAAAPEPRAEPEAEVEPEVEPEAEVEPEPEPLPESAAFGDRAAAETPTAAAGFRLSDEAEEEERTSPPPEPGAEEEVEPEPEVEADAFEGIGAGEEEEPEVGENLYGGPETAGGELEAEGLEAEDLEAEGLEAEDLEAGGWSLEDEETAEGPAAEVGELQVSEPEPPVDSVDLEVDTDFEGFDEEVDLEAEPPAFDEEPGEPDLGGADLGGADLDADLGGEPEPLRTDEEEGSWSPGLEGAGEERRGDLGEVAAPEAPAATEPEPEPEEDRDATADLTPPAAPAPASSQVTPPPAPADAAASGGSQVAPPTDLQGPGRAFAGTAAPAAGEADARHDEARRLARLLVSEIRLYNEEEVDEGRRNNDIYERLKEDIDRSRQMYEERVDPSIREDNDYFYEELVRNLGGGDAKTLGL